MPYSEDEEPLPEVDPAYLAFFSESVDEFRAHLSGRDGSDPPPASYFAPRAHWTSAEKNAFFRGLAVHSRLRPDLIAEEVRTKTTPDVCVYLAILEEAGREMTGSTTYSDEPSRAASVKIPREDLPAALEVSEEWIAFEERMASAIIASQLTSDREAVTRVREQEVQAFRTAIRAPRGAARKTSQGRDREGEKRRREELNKWLAERKSDWESEDLLLSLDCVGLKTLDGMLKDGEEGRDVFGQASGYNSEEEPEPLPETLDIEQAADEEHPSVWPIHAIDDQLIDPLLLEISRSASSVAMPGPPPNTVGYPSVPELPSPALQPVVYPTPPVLSSSLPASPQLSLHPTPTTVAAPSVGTNEGSVEDLSQMSPSARRRYQKRLYMRKKRAQATGGVAVESAGRLKPGKKPKKAASVEDLRARATMDAPSSPGAPGDAPQPAALPAPQDTHHASQKVRKPRRIQLDKRRVEFISKGIDVQRLRREGLDLFHLQAVSKLMQTYNQLHDVPQSVGSAISGEVLSMLHNLVVNFVAEVMSRAVTWREQERVAKLQTKAWRLRENQVISAPNVKQALMLYGAESLDKRAHFARLLDRLGIEAEESEGEAADGKDQDTSTVPPCHFAGGAEKEHEESLDDEADELPLKPLSLLQTIFPPLTNLPSGQFGNTSTAVDPSVYMPWPSSSLPFGDVELSADEDLLPVNVDETLLVDEMVEEVQLNKEDRRRAVDEEKALWARVNAKDPNPNLCADAVESDPEDPLISVEEPKTGVVRERPLRKRKREAVDEDAGAKVDPSREKGVGGGNAVEKQIRGSTTADAAMDVDEPEQVARKRPRKGRGGQNKNYLSQQQLLYMQPGADSRIKSSVYVLDSD